MSEHYRDSPEWQDVVEAINRLQRAQDERDGDQPYVVVDFVLTAFIMPQTPPVEEDDPVAGYMNWSTSPIRHSNYGLHHEGQRYWNEVGG